MAVELIGYSLAEGMDYTRGNEGYSCPLYRCSKGYLTGGWGHRVKAWDRLPEVLTRGFWEIVFKKDYQIAMADFIYLANRFNLGDIGVWRTIALTDMCFQMGRQSVSGFKNTLRFLASGRWAAAGKEVLSGTKRRYSEYYLDTPGRAIRTSEIFLFNKWPAEAG